MADIRTKSQDLTDLFITKVEARCPELQLASPRDRNRRGSQVSFHFHEGYAAMQAVIARGVIGDFRAPDIMRFGVTPLYISEAEILGAVGHLEEILNTNEWDTPVFRTRAAVT